NSHSITGFRAAKLGIRLALQSRDRPMLSTRSLPLSTLVAGFVLAAMAQPVAAQTTIWTNGGTNFQWGNGGNWSAGVPTAASTALFGGQGPGTVTLGA